MFSFTSYSNLSDNEAKLSVAPYFLIVHSLCQHVCNFEMVQLKYTDISCHYKVNECM